MTPEELSSTLNATIETLTAHDAAQRAEIDLLHKTLNEIEVKHAAEMAPFQTQLTAERETSARLAALLLEVQGIFFAHDRSVGSLIAKDLRVKIADALK